ncbi:NTP transferase domain-containing protein [Sphingosinicella sp. LHD-64]|uniref:NTP transferase domain-containing protein n=1 Tax=Sphingosinicella sp. LHD-64 TaxID=3072139 RepID=UPI00280EE8C0|nr:NTP transferase domain-containing protein [Sphingosinicella sp. LHD-64]MDQ8756375.1 NTP transferase domain-containing protein [Sphingosinicella sp. LHD-64]
MIAPAGSVHALLLAGQRPGPDALADHFHVPLKVLVPLAGEPMLSRIARTLVGHPAIGRVTILGADAAVLGADPGCAWLTGHPKVTFAAGASTISQTVLDAMGTPTPDQPVLVTTGDHPLLTRAMIDEFLDRARAAGTDLAVAMVEERLYRTRFDGRRTWIRFRAGAYSGANLFLLSNARARIAIAFWREIEAHRKKGGKIVAAFGPLLLAGVGLRLLSLKQALRLAGKRLGLTATAVELSDPVACIDVDKVEDHALATRLIAEAQHG